MSILKKINLTTVKGEDYKIKSLIETALKNGINPLEIVKKALQPAMNEVGEKFSTGKFYIPDLLLASKTMHEAMIVLKPHLVGDKSLVEKGVVVLGTIKGDLHDIGKNLVATMLEGSGYKVVDLGVDVDYEKFVEAIKKYNPKVVGFSGLLTTTLANIPNQLKAIEDAGLRGKVMLAVGGAPVTKAFADRYGIELYADDAYQAAKVIDKVIGYK